MSARVTTTQGLKALNDLAAKNNYNRQIADEAINRLDPEGFHIIVDRLFHEHAQGVPVAPHFRCEVLMKFKGDKEPHKVHLDIPIDQFNALPDARVLAEGLRK